MGLKASLWPSKKVCDLQRKFVALNESLSPSKKVFYVKRKFVTFRFTRLRENMTALVQMEWESSELSI